MKKKGILSLIALLISVMLSAQKIDNKEVGIRFAYGFENEVLPEGKVYKPIMILPYYNHYFTKAEKRARFSGMLEQQFVPVIIDYEDNPKNDVELEIGLNAGPAFSYKLSRWFTPYIGAMYGVDFITVKTRLQENGWILAATGFSGVKAEIANNVYGDVHLRFRHISNGGAKKPNLGIDTWFIGAGISKLY